MNEHRYHLGIDSQRHPLLSQWIRNNPWRWQKAARDVLEAALQERLLPPDLRQAERSTIQLKLAWVPAESVPISSLAAPTVPPAATLRSELDVAGPSSCPPKSRDELKRIAREALLMNDF